MLEDLDLSSIQDEGTHQCIILLLNLVEDLKQENHALREEIVVTEEVSLPGWFIEEYELAKQAYFTYEERIRLHGERTVHLLPSFRRAFDQIIIAASDDNDPELKRRVLREAKDALSEVVRRCRGIIPPINSPSNPAIHDNVVLPKSVIDLYHLTKDAQLSYSILTKEHDSLRLPLFMTALDHVVNAAQSEGSAKLGFLANAKEYLLRISSETYEEAILELLSRIRKAGLSKICKTFIFLWNDAPPGRHIEDRISAISDALIEGRLLTGKTDRADDCINRMKLAYEFAWKLNEEIRQRSLKPLAKGILAILAIGVPGSLIAWAIGIFLLDKF